MLERVSVMAHNYNDTHYTEFITHHRSSDQLVMWLMRLTDLSSYCMYACKRRRRVDKHVYM